MFSIASQLVRYVYIAGKFHRLYISKVGYKNDIPEKFMISFAQYCMQNQLSDLMALFELPLCAWGYESPEDLPAWYVFGMMGPVNMLGLFTTMLFGSSVFLGEMTNGYGTFASRLAYHERLEVKTGTEVCAIARQSDGVLIRTTLGTERFDSVVIATTDAARLLSDPTDEERAFLSDPRYAPYSTTLCALDKKVGEKTLIEANLRKKTR